MELGFTSMAMPWNSLQIPWISLQFHGTAMGKPWFFHGQSMGPHGMAMDWPWNSELLKSLILLMKYYLKIKQLCYTIV